VDSLSLSAQREGFASRYTHDVPTKLETLQNEAAAAKRRHKWAQEQLRLGAESRALYEFARDSLIEWAELLVKLKSTKEKKKR
jgi:hypothetical protein